MFFDDWQGLWRILLISVMAYALLILVLRLTGKRTLSKMNAFDFVITVSFGSMFATILLNEKIAFAEGFLGLSMLCLLQLVVTWLSVRWPWFECVVKSSPSLVFYEGRFLTAALQNQRITENEIMAAMRSAGVSDASEVDAVVLETNGDLSVLPKVKKETGASTLSHLL